MRGNRENTSSFQGQRMNLHSTGLEFTSRENMRVMPPNDRPGRPAMDDASRKRKASDSDFISNQCNDASTRYGRNLSSNSGHFFPREPASRHSGLTVDCQPKPGNIFSEHYSSAAKPPNEPSQCGDHQFYNLNNSHASHQRSGGNFQVSDVDVLHHKASSFVTKTPVVLIPYLSHAQNVEHDFGRHNEANKFQSYHNQSSDCVEKTQAGSNFGMNSDFQKDEIPNIQRPPNILSSRDLTFLGPSPLRKINEDCNQALDFCKNGLTEVKRTGQNMVLAEDKDLSIQTTSDGERKASYPSYRCADTEMRSSNYSCNDSLGAHLNVRDEDLVQVPADAETSVHDEACLENGMPKYSLISDLGAKHVIKHGGSNDGTNCHHLGASSKGDNCCALSPVEFGDGQPSVALDKQSKFVDKLWDGSLKLNTTTTVSAVAFFKSGEKAQNISWPDHIEIKGKVRLDAFEKFIQELPRSRSRTLMVISLCWKMESSTAGLETMKQVAKNYRETKRVGFAHVCPGYDLYLCPRSYAIITILAKHGFFKGMTAIEEDQNSFVGCILWRKGLPVNSTPRNQESDTASLGKQPVNLSDTSITETISPIPKVLESNPTTRCTKLDGVPNEFVSGTMSNELDKSRHTTESTYARFIDDSSKPTSSAQETTPTYTSTVKVCTTQPPTYTSTVKVCTTQQPTYTSTVEACSSQQPTVEACTSQQPGSTLTENAEIPAIKIAEPRVPYFNAESIQPSLPGPPPTLSETQQSSRLPRQNSHRLVDIHTGSAQEFKPSMPFKSLQKQANPSATQWPNSNSQEESTKLGIPATAELKKSDMHFDLSGLVFSGSTQELLQRLLGSSRDAYQSTVKGTDARETAAGSKTTKQTPPRAPDPLPQAQKSVDHDEGDDLPEFDFKTACGVQDAPVTKFLWDDHEYRFPEAPQINRQLPNVVPVSKPTVAIQGPLYHLPVKKDTHLVSAVALSKQTEVMQRLPSSSLPEKKFSSDPVINLPAKSKEQPGYQAPLSLSRPLSPASPRLSKYLARKNHWYDDDDMPEWCPPDLEHVNQPQTSSILGPAPVLGPLWQALKQGIHQDYQAPEQGMKQGIHQDYQAPEQGMKQGIHQGYQALENGMKQGSHQGYQVPEQGMKQGSHQGYQAPKQGIHQGYEAGLLGLGLRNTYIRPAQPPMPGQNQGNHRGNQSRLHGPHSTYLDPASSSQTTPNSGFALHPAMRQNSRPPIGKFGSKPPADFNRRCRRP